MRGVLKWKSLTITCNNANVLTFTQKFNVNEDVAKPTLYKGSQQIMKALLVLLFLKLF